VSPKLVIKVNKTYRNFLINSDIIPPLI
jgi:hypothetical protein